jgi:hypothetical protein
MKAVFVSIGALVAIAALVMILQMLASERGEVVVITTTDVAGAQHETHVWIVDDEGHPWIRSGSQESGWYARLKETPTLDLERNGAHIQYTVEAVAEKQAHINALMRAKYGWADAYIGVFFPRVNSVAIRLDLRAPEA